MVQKMSSIMSSVLLLIVYTFKLTYLHKQKPSFPRQKRSTKLSFSNPSTAIRPGLARLGAGQSGQLMLITRR